MVRCCVNCGIGSSLFQRKKPLNTDISLLHMQAVYRGISYLLYPGSMAALGLVYVHTIEPVSTRVWLLFLCGSVVFPLLSLAMLIGLGKVSDVFVFRREQRHGLYALGILFSGIASWFIFRENAVTALIWSVCNMVVLAVLFLINFWGYKASAHMAGVAGLLGWLICLQMSAAPMLAALIMALVVYRSRKGLSAHSHFELLLGFCLGLFVTFAFASLLLTYYGISCSFI